MDQDVDDRAAASLAAAARALRAGVERSRALGKALARAGPRLEEIQAALPALEAAVRPIRAPMAELAAAGPHIDRAVGPAAAVLKVFDAVHGLEPPLLLHHRGPGAVAGAAATVADLPGYLAVLGRLEEALGFLSNNCGLAAQWLADIVEYLGDHDLADPRFLAEVGVLLDADGFLFGFPARYGAMAAQMQAFFESTAPLCRRQQLAGKPAGFFVSTSTQCGGQETTAKKSPYGAGVFAGKL
jgi:exocyst complex protein 7